MYRRLCLNGGIEMKIIKRKLCIMVVSSLLSSSFISLNQDVVDASSIIYHDRSARDQRMKESQERQAAQRAQRKKIESQKAKNESVSNPQAERLDKAPQPIAAPAEEEKTPPPAKVETTPPPVKEETPHPSSIAAPVKEVKRTPQYNISSTDYNYRTPSPMSFQEAERYSKRFPREITFHTQRIKDKFGNKNRDRIFDFINTKGLYHSGSTITGVGDTSAIRFSVDYGFENITSTPVASVGWLIGSTGNWGTFRPKYINFVFDEGDTITIPVGKYNFNASVNSGIFVTSILNEFHGLVVLSPQYLYALSNHRQLQSVYISDGSGGIVHLFYSGDKDKQEKLDMMRGFYHACKMLDVTYETVANLTALQEKNEEAQRRSALIESVKEEIERDKVKEELLAEMNGK